MQTDDAEGALFDRNRALSASYEQGPRWFIPGYDASHAMAAVLLRCAARRCSSSITGRSGDSSTAMAP
jgi:hypothetical protein